MKTLGHGSVLRGTLLALLFWGWTSAGTLAAESAAEAAAEGAQTALKVRTLLFSRLSGPEEVGESPINTITQDRQGYIWYGTHEGLSRYDGHEVVVYEHFHDDPGSLSTDWVWAIHAASDGKLWVGTEGGGLNQFDRETERFTHFRHDPDNAASLSSDRVRVIFEDRKGIFWIGTDGGGLNRMDPAGAGFERFQHDPEAADTLPHDTILAIHEDRADNFWVGTNGGGLALMDRGTGRFTRFQHDPQVKSSLSDNRVSKIFEDREGRLWIGTYEGGVNLYDPVHGNFRHYMHQPDVPHSLSNNRVRDIYQDHDGTLWVSTDNGLNEWRPAEQGFVRYHHDPTDISSLSDDRVTALYQDRGGVLWVGTYNGLNKWNYVSDAFTYFQNNGTAIRLSSNIVTSLGETENGELWVGTYGGGVNRINLAAQSVQQYRQSADAEGAEAGSVTEGLPDDRVMALAVDENQRVWIGTRGGGLSLLDPTSDEFTHFAHDPADAASISSNKITSILAEANGQVWVGTYGSGLNQLDTSSGHFTVYRHQPADPASIGSDRVLAIYRDRSGDLWVGTEDGGLNRFDEATQSFVRYRHDASDPQSLSADSAWSIHESGDGALWVGTNGGGLNRWAPVNRAAGRASFEHFRKGDALRSDAVQAMLEDNAGNLWISSNRGLLQLDPIAGALRHFSRDNGLKGSEFNFAARLRSRSNRLFFGGSAGLVSFEPSRIGTNRHQPDIVLGAFNQEGPLTTRYSVDESDDILELDHKNTQVTFRFAGLDYAAPRKNRYRYKLEGFDRGWTETNDFKRATYTNLPAGTYQFLVQAANNHGVWNQDGVSMQLLVHPPPWRSTWAYIAYALIVLSVFLGYLRAQRKKLEDEARQRHLLEEEVQSRTSELAERNEELVSLNKRLKESNWTDSLTGLKNRRFLDEFIETEVALALRQIRDMDLPEAMLETLDIAPSLCFMMIDLDGFKAINDAHGHHAGDEALIQVKDILVDCCRKSDTIIRWGGDEFLVIGRNTSNRSAEKLAERIRVGLAEHQFHLGCGAVGRLSGSIGFAVYPFLPLKPEIANWEQVSTIADQCAYLAKENGRNAWVGLYGNRQTTAADVAGIKTDLSSLLARGAVGLRTSLYEQLRIPARNNQQTIE